jgi:polysaccharide export outer membrane protein
MRDGLNGLHPLAALLLILLAAAGCAALPRSGPSRSGAMAVAALRVQEAGSPGTPQLRYALVSLSPRILPWLTDSDQAPLFSGASTDAGAAEVRIEVGDVLSVTIFESAPGGLFVPPDAGSRPGNFVQIPAQQVDRSGVISIPFGQRVRAAGRTPAQIQREIERRLTNRALEPQAVVGLVERRASAVSVLGEVGNAARFTLDPGGERLLGAIARAGGSRFPPYETMITLQRDGRAERALLSDVALRPDQNIQLRPGDVVFLSREPRYFVAVGALGQATGTVLAVTPSNRRFPFEDTRLSLAGAIGRAGGLQDDRANPRGVFLYRFESPATLRRMGVVAEAAQDAAAVAEAPIPTIYTVDLEDPAGFFLANRFAMRSEDVIFVSNAPAIDVQRFLALVLPFSQSGAGFRSVLAP